MKGMAGCGCLGRVLGVLKGYEETCIGIDKVDSDESIKLSRGSGALALGGGYEACCIVYELELEPSAMMLDGHFLNNVSLGG